VQILPGFQYYDKRFKSETMVVLVAKGELQVVAEQAETVDQRASLRIFATRQVGMEAQG